MPSHGIAYDTWAGVVTPQVDDDGFTYIPEHVSIGIYAAPLYGALGILAAVLRARETGAGADIELAQSDCAAAFDWYRSETWRAYERPEDEVTGNPADDYVRRAPGTAGMREGVRYQIYATKDGHVLFMASEQAFWRNFCEGVGRMDLFERWPGSKYADHARGNRELQAELRDIFATRTSAEWMDFGGRANTPIAPVNTPQTLARRPAVPGAARLDPRRPARRGRAAGPVKFVGEELPVPTKAPEPGEHSYEVLRAVCDYDDSEIARLRADGALG